MHDDRAVITNLDILCAEKGRELAHINGMEEKVLNEALAVLEEQGPYAMFLYIRARYKKVENAFTQTGCELLRRVFPQKSLPDDIFDAIKSLAKNLDDLLFARDLLRNTLAYARYHVKAGGNEEKTS